VFVVYLYYSKHQSLKIMVAWLPAATGEFKLVANSPLDV
jgi:hypothetical protein